MIRVLQVVTNMSYGGLENFIMNNYRNIDRTKVQFDFLTHFAGHQDYEEEIEALGGKIYRLPKFNPFSLGYLSALDNFFKEHKEYKVVHSHLNCFSGVILKYAKKYGVQARIAHSHIVLNKELNLEYIVKSILKKSIPAYSTDLFACGDEAGRFMFGKNSFKVINNSIDAQQYVYDQIKSERVKSELGLSDCFVIGHVGMFREQKNHPFLFATIRELIKTEPSVKLLSVGNGPLFEEMKAKAKEMRIEDNVLFLGGRSDVLDLMQAMDVFVLPSLFEGFPVTMVEAQAAGLPCVISDKVASECKLTDAVVSVSLDSTVEEWANAILTSKSKPRINNYEIIKQAGFDIKANAKWLEDFYVRKHNGQ